MRRQRRAESNSFDTIVGVFVLIAGCLVFVIPFMVRKDDELRRDLPFEFIQASPIIGVILVFGGVLFITLRSRR